MLNERLEEKSIVEEIKDKNMETKKLNLIPNKSIGIFVLGDDIQEYLYLPHKITRHEEYEPSYDSYDFYESNVVLWVEEGKINTIRCTVDCYWEGYNLIKMPFEEFILKYEITPNKSESIYTLVGDNRGQNQMVYDFDDLGLIIWVWRKKIVTILSYNSMQEEK